MSVSQKKQTEALRNVDHEARSVSKPAHLSRVDVFPVIESKRVAGAEELQKSVSFCTDQAKLYFAGRYIVIPFLRRCGPCPLLPLWQHTSLVGPASFRSSVATTTFDLQTVPST